jgi:hypothetical protein
MDGARSRRFDDHLRRCEPAESAAGMELTEAFRRSKTMFAAVSIRPDALHESPAHREVVRQRDDGTVADCRAARPLQARSGLAERSRSETHLTG